MRPLAAVLAGHTADPAAMVRLFVLFLLATFAVEVGVMVLLPWIVSPDAPVVIAALVDSAILTAAIAPIVWRFFILPLRRLHDVRGLLLDRVLKVQENERARIARDLHDGIGQNLTSMLLHLRVMEETQAVDVLHDHAATLRRIASSSLDDLRRMVRETRPPVLDDLGLRAALDRQVADVREASGIETSLSWGGDPTARLPVAVETTLYRVIQEALTNVVRHSGAGRATVTLTRTDHEVVVMITDDGRGFDVGAVFRADLRPFGLLGMEERVRPLGGSACVASGPGRGTQVEVRIPLDAEGDVP